MFIKDWGIRKVITQEDIMKNQKLHDSVCEQIQIGYNNSDDSSWQWRNYHRSIDEALKQLHADDRQVYDLAYSYKKSFVAMFQGEGLTPVFNERDYFDKEITQKINKIAEFDIENMKKDLKDKKILSDIFDYGVGLRVYNGYDKVNKCPLFITPSPLSWYYDPNWSIIDNDFDYHLFNFQTSLSALQYTDALSWWYFDLEEVETGDYSRNSENQDWKKYRLQNSDDSTDNTVYVYNCFITINSHRYFCVLANDQTKIIKWERLLPRTKEEKENGILVPFKISISNAMVDAYSPTWVSYREKIYPTQIALTEVINAIHSKQMRDAWYDRYLYDIDRIDNPANLLVKPTGWPLFIPATNLGWWPITTPVMESNDTTKTQEYIKQLEYYAENTTSLTGIVRWLSPDAGTLGEAEIQMQKSNALFSVDATTLVAGERMFWINIYYRSLQENLPFIREKAAVLGIDWWDIVTLKSTELKWFNTPYITIKSKRKVADDNNRRASSMQAMLPIVMQDPEVSPIGKKMFKRELFSLQWQGDEFTHTVYDMNWSEKHAARMQDIVNLDMIPDNLVIPWLDLQTLWIYINRCVDNDSKEKVLNSLTTLMIEKWLNKPAPTTPWMEWVANSMAAQSMSADIAQKQQALPNN